MLAYPEGSPALSLARIPHLRFLQYFSPAVVVRHYWHCCLPFGMYHDSGLGYEGQTILIALLNIVLTHFLCN